MNKDVNTKVGTDRKKKKKKTKKLSHFIVFLEKYFSLG